MTKLSADDFSGYIAERSQNFTGRQWVFQTVESWLEEQDSPPVFLLTGEPGSGKSGVAARLVQMSQGEVPADEYKHLGAESLAFYHFCQAGRDTTLNPLRFIEALATSLAAKYDAYRKALQEQTDHQQHIAITPTSIQTIEHVESDATVVGVNIEVHIGDVSAQGAFDRVIREPLEVLCTSDFNQQIVILVDALDEARTLRTEETVLTLLGDITDDPHDLPPQVRLILTTRPDPQVLSTMESAGPKVLDLIANRPTDVDDLYTYSFGRLHMISDQKRRQVAAKHLSDAANGNFLYARYVLDDPTINLEQAGDLSALDLPKDLKDIYSRFVKRELGRELDRWDEHYAPLLGVLAVARHQGLTPEQVKGITGLPASQTRRILRTCVQYLAGLQPNGPFRIYHQSFRDFLVTNTQFQIDPPEAHQAIATYFIKKYGSSWLDCAEAYALQYTVAHLIEAEQLTSDLDTRVELLRTLILDFIHWLDNTGMAG